MSKSPLRHPRTGSRSLVFKRTRARLQRWLPQPTYETAAGYYNALMARLVERESRKPIQRPVSCDQSLIYISQPPRSGGTLMRNLFDGHPSCHGFPHELSWEKNGYRWGEIKRRDAAGVYEKLYDRWLDHAIVNGLDKKYPFHFNRTLQKKLFRRLAENGFENSRGWLDAYVTSFFNTWIDYQGLYGEKSFTVAFCPWSFERVDSIERFFAVYPEGYRLHVVRNPLGWWASEKKYGDREKSLDEYLADRWIRSVEVGLEAKDRYEEQYILVHFDDLIRSPETSMRALADRVGIRYTPALTRPTINRIPRTSNTSFGPGKKGLDPSVLDRWREYLDDDEIEAIQAETDTLYRRAVSRCINASRT